MWHIARLSKRFDSRPSHIECSCGVAGDFLTDSEARAWMETQHFRFLTGIDTSELSEQTSANPPSEPDSGSVEAELESGSRSETVGDA